MATFSEDFARIDPEELNSTAQQKGKQFAQQDKIRTNQIRNFFSALTKIRSEFHQEQRKSSGNGKELPPTVRKDLVMLRPKLAYAAGRHSEVRAFQEFFDEAISAVLKSENPVEAIKNLFFLSDAVLAYHKYFGGKD
ncbi:MAG: hypothetical protein Kow0042_20720 [Calditrichia bacterium]